MRLSPPEADDDRVGWELQISAELALTACTVAAIITFWRLFIDNSFFPRLFLVAVTAHGSAALWRRLGRGLPLSALAHLVVGIVTLGLIFQARTTLAGIPTPDTFWAARADLIEAWRQFEVVKAPAPVLPGFLLAGAVAAWWAAFVADWGAFRLWLPLESLVPSASIFIFASLMGLPDQRVLSSMVWLTPALVFALLHRVMLLSRSRGWISTGEPAAGPTLSLGIGAIAIAVVVASLAGPRIPGADADPILDVTGNGTDNTSRMVPSPFLELNARLKSQSNAEMFSVRVPEADPSTMPYWRMTSLHKFDGLSWSSPQTDYKKAHDELPTTGDAPAQQRTLRQTFRIQNLGTIWLPAAYQATSVDAPKQVRWDPNSSTLIVGDDATDGDGFEYTVESQIPDYDRAAVAAAGDGPLPDSVVSVDLELPDDFSPLARAEARRVVAGITKPAPTPFDKALALQQFFVGDGSGFDYDLNPPPVPAGVNPIDDFLRNKTGFCQQYAGTYAAMARAIGLPARVAVGFTPGIRDAVDPEVFHVRGLHAHAWPEVYITGQGWVPFEPTPSRGQGAFSDITGRTADQEGGPAPGLPGQPGQSIVPLPGLDPGGPLPAVPGVPQASPGRDAAEPSKDSWWLVPLMHGSLARRIIWGLIGGLVVLVVVAGAPILWWRAQRRRRRQQAVTPAAVVAMAWDRALSSLALLGFHPARSDTHVEVADNAEAVMGTPILLPLATALTMAAFSAEGADDLLARSATELADEVEAAVDARLSWPQRLAGLLRPWTLARRASLPNQAEDGARIRTGSRIGIGM